MKAAPFVYHRPQTIAETVAILAEVAPQDGRILAGGQSLVPGMAFRLARPAHLVDINAVSELTHLSVKDGALRIGAGVRHAAFHVPVPEGNLGRLLSVVARHIAHYPIRLRGTFCGSLAHADPASEWCAVAVTLGAHMEARSRRGTRSIAADDFFHGMMATDLADDELLAEVRLPLPASDARFGFYEFSRRAGDYALAMGVVSYRLEDGRMVEPRLGVGGAEARPRRIPEAEAELGGRPPGAAAFAAAGEAAAAAIDPLEDVQADAVYRRELVCAVVRRALERAAA